MKFKVIGTGSKGNCYLFQASNGYSLLVEAGVSLKKIKEALYFDISKLDGCLITHDHSDHAKSVHELSRLGIDIYSSSGTINALNITGIYVDVGVEYKIGSGGFSFIPFDVQHDCVEPLGFIIKHSEMGQSLFLTDTQYTKYRFSDINHLIIEANHSVDTIKSTAYSGRTLRNHMSIETACDIISLNSDTLRTVVLTHLSDDNGHSAEFKNMAENVTDSIIYIAENGITIEL